MKGWIDLGSDVNWIDHGGLWGRKGRDGAWYIVRFTDFQAAAGALDVSKYNAEVLRIDLAEFSAERLTSALDCIGASGDADEQERVYACVAYGGYAPLDDFYADGHAIRLRAKARRAAESYMRDAVALDKRMDRVVNMIGSTARDFGRGDIDAGLRRYAAGDAQ